MKMILRKLFLVPLVLAMIARPALAQTDSQPGSPPAPHVVPAPEIQAATNPSQESNLATAAQMRRTNGADKAQTPAHADQGYRTVGYVPVGGPTVTEVVGYVAIFGTVGIVPVALLAVFLYFRHRRNELLHQTLRTMVEKGVPIPPELITVNRPNPVRRSGNDLRRGLFCTAVGLGMLMVALAARGKAPVGELGFIPLFIGVAFLVSWKLQQPKQGQLEN